jgi:hypothetical protein
MRYKVSLELELRKYIESNKRRHKKFQADRQSFDAQSEGEKGSEQQGIILHLISVYNKRGKVARGIHSKPITKDNFEYKDHIVVFMKLYDQEIF